MKYNALVVCQNSSDRKPKPFIVSVYSYFDKDVVISDLEKYRYKDSFELDRKNRNRISHHMDRFKRNRKINRLQRI